MSRPSASKNRISTVSGSPGAGRVVDPPPAWPLRTRDRVSGPGATSTSPTLLAAQFRRASDDASAQARARADVHVVVADSAFDERLSLHDHVGPEDGVLPEVGAGLDPAVVPDHHGPVDPGRGVDVGALAEPNPLPD